MAFRHNLGTAEDGVKVLVCGGREYQNIKRVFQVLDGLTVEHGPLEIVQGGSFGADACASEWAYKRNRPDRQFPAEWHKHGRAAGPIRNQQMLEEGKPDLVVAFPGGGGTADMVRRAKAEGVPVIEVK